MNSDIYRGHKNNCLKCNKIWSEYSLFTSIEPSFLKYFEEIEGVLNMFFNDDILTRSLD